MIQPNELRLGNLIQSEGEIFTVSEIKADFIEAGSLGIYPAGFELDYSIPITEEWLKRFGFEQNYAGYEHPSHRESGRWITRKFILSEEKLDTPFLRFDGMVDVYFVHQLQNLYFALTGEELTLKEKLQSLKRSGSHYEPQTG